MSSIAKTLIGSFAALLVCAGEAALFATDTAAVGPGHPVSVGYAAVNRDRPAHVAALPGRIAASADRSRPPG
jgi:hypothetical protein